MRKIVILAALVITLAARPAHADCRGRPCPLVLDLFAYSLAATMVGGYAYGTGYFVYHDATDETQTLKYGAGELAYNGTFGALFTYGTIESIKDHDAGTAFVMGSLAAVHDTLAIHGIYRTYDRWQDPRFGHAPDHTREWIGGITYGLNTLIWTVGLTEGGSRTYGIAEASVNAPIAAAFGYLAYDRLQDRERGPALLYAGMATLSGAFAYHGLRMAIDPPESKKFDLLGSDVIPVAVSDGRETAPGLGVSGTF